MDNGCESSPKIAYGRAGYGRTFATRLLSLVLDVARHGNVEFSGIKEVRVFSNRLDVEMKPARDMRGAEL